MPDEKQRKEPKYFVNIEGNFIEWDSPTITTEEIITLGGWSPDVGAIEIDLKTNVERTLSPGEVIEIKPGQGFGKKIQYKRGYTQNRLAKEIEMLREVYNQVTINGNWVHIKDFPVPSGIKWSKSSIDVCFQVPEGYPGIPPDGFYIPAGTTCDGKRPNNYSEPAPSSPPFDGTWGFFSWHPVTGWTATSEAEKGSNLQDFARTMSRRLSDGV